MIVRQAFVAKNRYFAKGESFPDGFLSAEDLQEAQNRGFLEPEAAAKKAVSSGTTKKNSDNAK
ncbi:MAG: hypothetical protein SPK23_01385 [Eubacteriales bacterium]|nr:hypothetical protein [Eubacteriales bacterium]